MTTMQRTEAEANALAHISTAITLAREVANVLDVEMAQAVQAIWSAPPNLHPLLACPEGWAVLACYVADVCGKPMPNYTPAVH